MNKVNRLWTIAEDNKRFYGVTSLEYIQAFDTYNKAFNSFVKSL